jgi:nicotinamide-nucleotide amidase
MVNDSLVPYLTERLGGSRQTLRSRVLRVIGIGESAMEEKVRDLLHGINPTVAPLAHLGEAHLRITARAESVTEAESLIAPVEQALRERLGEDVYGADEESLEVVVIGLLRQQGGRLATAEATPGGALAARLSAVEGSAEPFPGGFVVGAVETGPALLGVPEALLREHGMVSGPAAEAFAEAARRKLGSDYGLSLVGLSGPGGGTAEKPVGLVFVGLAEPGGTSSRRHQFLGSPADIRQRAALVAVDALRRALLAAGGDDAPA